VHLPNYKLVPAENCDRPSARRNFRVLFLTFWNSVRFYAIFPSGLQPVLGYSSWTSTVMPKTIMPISFLYRAALRLVLINASATALLLALIIREIKQRQPALSVLTVCERQRLSHFYRTMLRRLRLCHSMWSVRPSVCLSICDVQACFSHRLEYFENNLRLISVRFLLNTGDLVQRETPELGWNRGGVNL